MTPPASPDKEADPTSLLLPIVSQLRKGMDLHRVALPTCILEPRSMCERITDFLSHPHIITDKNTDPVDKFLNVLKFFLSGWHFKPRGVKKPYNPVLGEFFRCKWTLQDNSESFYICEQVSHHPPISAWYYTNPTHKIAIHGEIHPKSKFLGNSAATIMKGYTKIIIDSDEYIMTLPNAYARNILFGGMFMEMGDLVTVRNEKEGLIAELEFKVKSMFSSTKDLIVGKIKKDGNQIATIEGSWSSIISIQDKTDKSVFLDINQLPIVEKIVEPEESQEEYESRRLWMNLTKAICVGNMDLATDEKLKVENNQREIKGDWNGRYFRKVGEEYRFIDEESIWKMDKDLASEVLKKSIFAKSQDPKFSKFWKNEKNEGSPMMISPVSPIK